MNILGISQHVRVIWALAFVLLSTSTYPSSRKIKIISIEDKKLALISANKSGCFYASLNNIETSEEIFRTKCLPEEPKNNDFNGLGSSNVHFEDSILLTLGTPEKHASKNSSLAQKEESKFGKGMYKR